jgi:hypothetical protein
LLEEEGKFVMKSMDMSSQTCREIGSGCKRP